MPTVWLIRHGESQSNAGEQTLCPEFTGLTKRGAKQAECVATAFTRPPSLVITSKYIRAQKTAEPTIRRFPNTKYQQWEVVREFTYLSWSNSSSMTMEERRPKVDNFWERNDPNHWDGDGAETFIQFASRVSGVLERLRYREEDFIAVFTHGQFMQAVLWLLKTPPSKIDPDSMRRFKEQLETISIPNGAILPIKLQGRRETVVGDIKVSHLSQLEENQPLGKLYQMSEDIRSFASTKC